MKNLSVPLKVLHIVENEKENNLQLIKMLFLLKGTNYAPFYKMSNKTLMSPERICEVLAQYTPQIHFYSLLKWPLLGFEPNALIFCMLL